MLDRRVFVCAPTRDLLEHINLAGGGLLRELEDEIIVATKEVDLDRDLEGWTPGILKAAKRKFIESHIGEGSVFLDSQDLAKFLGPGNPVEIFDKWFKLRELNLLEIGPEDWKPSRSE